MRELVVIVLLVGVSLLMGFAVGQSAAPPTALPREARGVERIVRFEGTCTLVPFARAPRAEE